MKTLLSILMMSICGSALMACTPGQTESVDTVSAEKTGDVETAIIQAVYDGFAQGNMAMVTGSMADDIVWNEAQGNPYADLNPYIGADAILSGLFSRLGGDWNYFHATPDEFIIEGNRVVAIGQYKASHKTTGNLMEAPFVHVWTVQDGKITTFQQYTDTLAHVVAMGG